MAEDHMQLLEDAIVAIERLKAEGGHLHSITNTVAQNFTANVLLACGASIAMTANEPEMEAFVTRADALHVNLGTLDDARMAAIRQSMAVAQTRSIPVLLDPVMIEASALRRRFAEQLLVDATIVRCNEAEAGTLDNATVQSVCKIVTGKVDRIVFEGKTVSVENGAPMLGSTIATGCALGALIAILASKTSNPVIAALGGLLWFNIAGELADDQASGPGSFAVALLDQLHAITPDKIRTRANLS